METLNCLTLRVYTEDTKLPVLLNEQFILEVFPDPALGFIVGGAAGEVEAAAEWMRAEGYDVEVLTYPY